MTAAACAGGSDGLLAKHSKEMKFSLKLSETEICIINFGIFVYAVWPLCHETGLHLMILKKLKDNSCY